MTRQQITPGTWTAKVAMRLKDARRRRVDIYSVVAPDSKSSHHVITVAYGITKSDAKLVAAAPELFAAAEACISAVLTGKENATEEFKALANAAIKARGGVNTKLQREAANLVIRRAGERGARYKGGAK